LIKKIMNDLVVSVNGAQTAVFLDGDGETISQSGDQDIDAQLIGAWKEIELDRIRDISKRLKLGDVRAVLFSLDQLNELVVPVEDEYCLLLLLSAYANIQDAMTGVKSTVERLKEEIG
jgi:predicted regulator of Ras-like GTPase activity (Roadblock/LC7/MglB family)